MEIARFNTRFLTRSPLKVKIIKVDSLSLFWVQLHNSQEDFKELMEDLNRRMARRSRFLHYRIDDIRLDNVVAIHEGRKWHRGMVTQIRGDGTTVITLLDWGRIVERPYFEIYLLEDRFRELEWQAIPCGLAHTGPNPAKKTWPRRARELTKFLIERREGWISIVGHIEEEAALVTLEVKTESGNETKNLKNLLIDLGYARHTEKALETLHPSI